MADRSLLPPNASPLERRLTEIMGRLGDIPSPLRELMQPDICPIELLPWLAWHLGVDAWKDYWPEEVKRARVKAAIPIARQNGTAAAVRGVIAAFGADIALREWWQLTPPGPPHTFDVVLTVNSRNGEPVTADFVADVIGEIDRTKPVRSHYTFTQRMNSRGAVAIGAALRVALYYRLSITES